MTQVAQGQVNDRPFVRTVYTIGAKRFSGDLTLVQGGASYHIAWHRGFVVGAEVPKGEGDLGSRAATIFSLTDGSFMLDDSSTLALRLDEEPVDPRWLIFHGVRDHYSLERLAQELQILDGCTVMMAPSAVSAVKVYEFPDEAAAVVTQLLRQPWELPELEEACAEVPAQLLRAAVYGLLATDALEVGRGARRQSAPKAAGKGTGRRIPPSVTQSLQTAELPGSGPAPRGKAPVTSEPDAPTVRGPALRPEDLAGLTGPSAAPVVAPVAALPAEAPAERPTAPPAEGPEAEVLVLLEAVEASANHFEVFGVEPQVPVATIRSRYFDLAKRLHPDRVRSLQPSLAPRAQKVFARVNEAFGVLSNEAKRADYIASLTSGTSPEQEAEQEAQVRAILEAEEKFQLGEMAIRRQQFAEALGLFEQAVELNPDEAEHHALYAWARWCASADKEPIARDVKKQLQRAIAMSPTNPRPYFYRGLIAKQSEDLDAAIAAFEKVLKLNPDHEGAKLELRLMDRRLAEEKKQRGGLMGRLRRK